MRLVRHPRGPKGSPSRLCLDSIEMPATGMRKRPHIFQRIRMDEGLNLSGVRIKKDVASVSGFMGFA